MLKKLLGFDPQTMALRTEIIAGITTFLTMSYILAVNPSILATTGMDKGAVFTATALASALATLLLAFMAKLPFAQAPSMALNAFFAFTLVQGMGYSWQTAMTAMFVEGVIFILITFLNVREVILNSIPMNLRFAISAGIGMFIAFVGLKNAGIIVPNPATFVMFGPFTPVSILAMVGILLSGILVLRKVKGALFYSILICTLIGIPLGVTEIPDGFLPVSIPHSMTPTFCQFDFNEFFTLDMAIVIFTLLFMNIFDTVGTTGRPGFENRHYGRRRTDSPRKGGNDVRCDRYDGWVHDGKFYDYHLCGECFRHCGRRTFRVHFAGDGCVVFACFVLCSLVPADSECGNDGGFGAGRGVYDGFYHKSRYGRHIRSASGFYHHDHDGTDLFHCRRNGFRIVVLCTGQVRMRQT